jgi:hypothetical protein
MKNHKPPMRVIAPGRVAGAGAADLRRSVDLALVVARHALEPAGGVTVDGGFDGTGSALVIRGTLAQVNTYLAGLQVKLGGSVRFHRETVENWLQSLITISPANCAP